MLQIDGVISGFDRLVLRGHLRAMAYQEGMKQYLSLNNVLLKEFAEHALRVTDRLKQASLSAAKRLGRPVKYLPSSQISKEETARSIAAEEGITSGLVCVLTCVEPCWSFEIHTNRETKKLDLLPRPRKCLFLYHYWIHPVLGLLNGQLEADWPEVLGGIAGQLNPIHDEILSRCRVDYYWSTYQSEWATDLVSRDEAVLKRLCPKLVHHGMAAFTSADVMRFLGRRIRLDGKVPKWFAGELVSDLKRRQEGVRIKHSMNGIWTLWPVSTTVPR
jgi:hypothetical protein